MIGDYVAVAPPPSPPKLRRRGRTARRRPAAKRSSSQNYSNLLICCFCEDRFILDFHDYYEKYGNAVYFCPEIPKIGEEFKEGAEDFFIINPACKCLMLQRQWQPKPQIDVNLDIPTDESDELDELFGPA